MQKVSDYIADFLAAERVPAVFELVGGMITHMLDSIHLKNKTPIISMRHEQGAAFAAEGCSRMLGRPAVAMATSGPGATNLLTGIGSCYFDSIPSVFITGQVNTSEQKGDRHVRQLGFQETDIVSMALPITKQAWRVSHEDQLPSILKDAFHLAMSGRPGPVLIDIPMDIQRARLPAFTAADAAGKSASDFDRLEAETVCHALRTARRPMILAGGGIRSGNAIRQFREFVTKVGVPVVHSLMGVDTLPYSHPLNMGMIGSYGNRWANLSLAKCDCLLVLGSRLDIRQTGANTNAFRGDRLIFHIDCETAEMNNRVLDCHTVVAEIGPALEFLTHVFQETGPVSQETSAEWLSSISALREKWPDTSELTIDNGINPNTFMHHLSQTLTDAAAYVVDIGQHQMWAAQSLELGDHQRFLTSGGMGSMGFALPAGIGAAVAVSDTPVVVIAGDGGFQCNIQELETASNLQLPLKLVVINNNAHGMVRQFQESYFEGRFQSTIWGYSAPDFAKVANAYEIPSMSIQHDRDLDSGMKWLANQPKGPALLQVMVPQNANAYPKLAFGHGLESMEPFVKPLDMEGT